MRDAEQPNPIFHKEQELEARAKRVLEQPPVTRADLLEEYLLLTDGYRKLLRDSNKMNRIADSNQNKLVRLKNQLEKQNNHIQEQQMALLEANIRLEEASLTDSLTDLRNRRFLINFLDKDIHSMARDLPAPDEKPRNFLFLMIDIDHFKLVNDTYGHAAGDLVLKQVAKLISDNCRKGDIPIRWGGEEFLMVCRDADRKFAPFLAERLREQVAKTSFEIPGGRHLNCTISLGFAFYPFLPYDPFRLSWEQVVDLADQGLYAAKRTRRDAWVGVIASQEKVGKSRFESLDLEGFDREGVVKLHTSLPQDVALSWH